MRRDRIYIGGEEDWSCRRRVKDVDGWKIGEG